MALSVRLCVYYQLVCCDALCQYVCVCVVCVHACVCVLLVCLLYMGFVNTCVCVLSVSVQLYVRFFSTCVCCQREGNPLIYISPLKSLPYFNKYYSLCSKQLLIVNFPFIQCVNRIETFDTFPPFWQKKSLIIP